MQSRSCRSTDPQALSRARGMPRDPTGRSRPARPPRRAQPTGPARVRPPVPRRVRQRSRAGPSAPRGLLVPLVGRLLAVARGLVANAVGVLALVGVDQLVFVVG